jgi:hypothetical protein
MSSHGSPPLRKEVPCHIDRSTKQTHDEKNVEELKEKNQSEATNHELSHETIIIVHLNPPTKEVCDDIH